MQAHVKRDIETTLIFQPQKVLNRYKLSEYIWKLKGNKQDFDITWLVMKRSIAYTGGSERRNLCLEEKLCILKENKQDFAKHKQVFMRNESKRLNAVKTQWLCQKVQKRCK